ncbi:hypothetical protein EV363DRAFT_1510673 [Boletus edulis]|nr:hypothetical protein EV363DRAFT_1510673 [Boletus edulis]
MGRASNCFTHDAVPQDRRTGVTQLARTASTFSVFSSPDTSSTFHLRFANSTAEAGFPRTPGTSNGRLDSCARLLPLVHSPSPVAHVHIGISASGKTLIQDATFTRQLLTLAARPSVAGRTPCRKLELWRHTSRSLRHDASPALTRWPHLQVGSLPPVVAHALAVHSSNAGRAPSQAGDALVLAATRRVPRTRPRDA